MTAPQQHHVPDVPLRGQSPDTSRSRVHDEFQAARYFPQLDGLRALSVVLVLTAHTGGTLLRPLHGYLGVTLFFVISGFLITTLLLREERAFGRISLRGFYLRRAFRIFPLYYLALAVFSGAVGAGLGEHPGDYPHRLIFFLTYTNEFASPGTFGHSWSLGVEEKFYLFWPLLAFVIPVVRRIRLALTTALLSLAVTIGLVAPLFYLGTYTAILAGCWLGVLLDRRRGIAAVLVLARPAVAPVTLVLVLAGLLLSRSDSHVQVVFSCLVALAFPGFLLGPTWLREALSRPWLTYVGRRSYAIYLFHPLVGSLVEKGIQPSGGRPSAALLYLLTTFLLSLAVADILHRVLERPMIGLGHSLTGRKAVSSPGVN